MKGQQAAVAFVLVTAIGLMLGVIYYIHIQGIFYRAKSELQRVLDEYTDLAKRNIEISSAIAKVDKSTDTVQLIITIANTGSSSIAIYDTSLYLYKDDILVFTRPIAPTDCNPLYPGATCIFTVSVTSPDYKKRDDIYNSYLVMYINNARKVADIEYAGDIPGQAIYSECDSCDTCTALISGADLGSIIMVNIAGQVSGDCIRISGVRDVTIYCREGLVGDGTGVGILIEDSEDVSIRGCEVSNFEYGVYIRNSQGLSFSTAYIHDNAVDIAFDKSTLSDVCTLRSADLVTTSGYVYSATGTQGDVLVLGASAVWLYGVDSSTFDGEGSTLSRVSPAITLCGTSSVSLMSFSIAETDVGVAVIDDYGTRLESLTVNSSTYGIYSKSSSNTSILNSTFASGAGDIFEDPSGVEWGASTVFRS